MITPVSCLNYLYLKILFLYMSGFYTCLTYGTYCIVTTMPDVKVYIRTEDVDKWNSIDKKSEFIHNALNGVHVTNYDFVDKKPKDKTSATVAVSSVREPLVEEVFTPKPPDPVTGYPCCTKAKPCKHWSFDGADNTWTNQLTGEVKEVVS